MTEQAMPSADLVMNRGTHVSSGTVPLATAYMELWSYQGEMYALVSTEYGDDACTVHRIGIVCNTDLS